MEYINLGGVYCDDLGDFRKAIEFFQQGLAIAKEVGDKESEGRAYGNLGIAYNYLYDVSKAVDFHRKKVSIARLIGDRLSEGEEYLNLGNCIEISAITKKQSSVCRKV